MNETPPATRSQAAEALDGFARAGRFSLQCCRECATVQYPPRDACVKCLSAQLEWQEVSPKGTLLAQTLTRVSAESYFQMHGPSRTGLVQMECCPTIVCFLEDDCIPSEPVSLYLKLDDAGRGVFWAKRAVRAG